MGKIVIGVIHGFQSTIDNLINVSQIKFLPFTVWKLFNLLMGTHLPVKKLFELSFGSGAVEKEVLDAYTAPFPSSLFKAGTAKYVLCC